MKVLIRSIRVIGICHECDGYYYSNNTKDCDCENPAVDWIDEDDNFIICADCDLPDACADFGCAIKQGLRE